MTQRKWLRFPLWPRFEKPCGRKVINFRPWVESLEDRTLLSTVNWIGGSGDWSNPNNWVEHIPRSPRTADRVNSYDFLLDRARMCASLRDGALANIVAVDYYNRGDLFGAVRALNGIPVEEKPQVRDTG